MGREASARQASAPRRSSGNRFRGSFRRRKSKQTRLNLAGEAGGANKKRRTGDDSSYALSLPIPSPVFSPRFVRVSISLPSPHHPLLFSLFSSNNTSGRNNGLSDFGKGRGSTAAGIVPPFYQRNYFYALQPSSPPHAFQYFTVALLRLSAPPPLLPDLIQFPR